MPPSASTAESFKSSSKEVPEVETPGTDLLDQEQDDEKRKRQRESRIHF